MKLNKIKTEYKIIAVSIFFGLVFWIFDSLLDYLIFYQGTFWEILIKDVESNELLIRLFAFVLFVLFGMVFLNVIKKRKIAEENFKKSEEHCKALFERVPVGLYRTTPNGEIIDVNNTMVEILGFPDRESLLKVNAVELYVNPGERERILKEENETGVIIDVEVQLRKYDASHIWVQYSSKAVKDGNGNIEFYEGSLRDITEHKNTKSLIDKQNKFLNNVFESIAHPLYVIDVKDYTIKMANSASQYKISNGDSTCYALTHNKDKPCDDNENPCPLELVKKTMKPVVVEHIHFLGDGSKRNVEVHGYPIFNDEGDIIQMIEYAIDITERKRTEDALHESEEKYRIIYEDSNDAIMLLTEKGFFDCNLRTIEIFRLNNKEEFKQSHPSDLSPPKQPDGQPSFEAAMDRIKTAFEQGSNQFEWIHRRANGEDFPAEVLLTAIDYKGNRVLQATVRDISERKQFENTLRESEEKFKALSSSAADAIMMIDNEGKITYWNESAVKMFGFTVNEVIGKELHSIIMPAKFQEAFNKAFLIFQKTGSGDVIGKTAELSALRKGGFEFPIELSLSALNIKDKWHSVGIVRDITKRKRTEEINSVLSQITEATITSGNLDELLNTIQKLLGQIIDTTNFYIALYNENTGKHSFPYFVDEHEEGDVESHELPKSLTDYVRRTGKPLLADEKVHVQLMEEGEVEMVGPPSLIWMGAPLKSTRGIFGVVVVQSYTDSSLYTEKDLELLTLVSGNIALAIERKNAEDQIKKSRVQLQNLSHKLQQVREDEKEKIAYGIYEDFTQVLAVLIMDISWLQNNIPKDNEELFEKLNSMKSLADKGIKDMLRVKEELRSSQLDYIGLDAATQWYLEELQKRSGIKFKLTYKISDIELSKNLSVMLYRVFEELMNNVERHSKAKNVSIDINLKDGILEMKVKDDGIGISDDKIDDSKSIGIIGIKERIRPYNGEVIFEGEHNKGTSVTVRIPLGRITDESE